MGERSAAQPFYIWTNFLGPEYTLKIRFTFIITKMNDNLFLILMGPYLSSKLCMYCTCIKTNTKHVNLFSIANTGKSAHSVKKQFFNQPVFYQRGNSDIKHSVSTCAIIFFITEQTISVRVESS